MTSSVFHIVYGRKGKNRPAQILFIFGALLGYVLKLTKEKFRKKNYVPFSENQHFSKIV